MELFFLSAWYNSNRRAIANDYILFITKVMNSTVWKVSIFVVFLVRIWIEYREMLCISPYSVQMQENANQYGHISRSVDICVTLLKISKFDLISWYENYFLCRSENRAFPQNFRTKISHYDYYKISKYNLFWIACRTVK